MELNDRILFWYREDRFTAEDVTRGTGLSERSQRELLKLGVLQPIPQAKTKARLLNSRMLKRGAVIKPLNQFALSLEVAGRIAYAAPMLEDLMFGIIDPWDVVFDAGSEFDHKTKLWERRKAPHNRDKWFDPAFPPTGGDADYFIDIINGRYVGMRIGKERLPGVFGELAHDMTRFVWWKRSVPHSRVLDADGERDRGPQWQYDPSMSPDMLKFDLKDDGEADEQEAKAACENPVSQLTVNVSLALRVALRRLVFVDGPAPERLPAASQEFLDRFFAGGPASARILDPEIKRLS